MSEGRNRFASLWPPLLLTVVSAFLICFRLDAYSLVNGDEAIYHAIAQQMVASGDWFTLDFKGELRVWDTVMNAPLQYWARALLIIALGDGLWAVRLLSALGGVASVLMTYQLVRKLSNRETALLAGLVQVTTLQFVYLHSARTGELDAILSLAITTAAFLFVRAVETGKSFVPHHLCLVLILNVKTPTVAIPLLAELAAFALLPSLRPRLRDWLRCSAWMLPLGLTWHLVQLWQLWDPIWQVFDRMGTKAAGDVSVAARAAGNLRYYASTLLFGGFPYSLFYPLALASVLLDDRHQQTRWRLAVLALFIAAIFAFYLPLAERNRWYVIPTYPFLSAFTAIWLRSLAGRRRHVVWLIYSAAAIAALGLLQVDATSFNPFADQANRIAMETRWRLLPVSPLLALLVSMAVIGLALGFAQRAKSFARALAISLSALLLGVGATRVLAPFAFLDHQSEMALLHARIDAARAAGDPVRTPIPVGEPVGARASFYFADDFEIVPLRGQSRLPSPIYFELREKRGAGESGGASTVAPERTSASRTRMRARPSLLESS